MAHNSKSSGNSAGRGAAKVKPRAGRLCTDSPYSDRSTVPTSKVDCDPLKPVAKLYKGLGYSVIKSA
ncbi:unnamed protein product [Penicillium roqueforti FM164]|uniref:Uncharacterized protein n=1 Tax=Penicillium roqueforti (strain FM164) TaxID=1365484 RepID=W6QWE1_PENRF|nr:unnamed protein product [Penicillium roqueforti FM164]